MRMKIREVCRACDNHATNIFSGRGQSCALSFTGVRDAVSVAGRQGALAAYFEAGRAHLYRQGEVAQNVAAHLCCVVRYESRTCFHSTYTEVHVHRGYSQ